jgi:hypothetical protein
MDNLKSHLVSKLLNGLFTHMFGLKQLWCKPTHSQNVFKLHVRRPPIGGGQLQCVVVATSSSLGNQQIVVEGAIGVCNGAATLKLTQQNITRGSWWLILKNKHE